MSLSALDPTLVHELPEFNDFLSQDNVTTAKQSPKLSPYPATKFEVLQNLGSGDEGLVLKCRSSQSSTAVALKLFFEGQPPTPGFIWPLKNEAMYYASCAVKRAQSSVSPPLLPKLPYTTWAQSNNDLDDKALLNFVEKHVLGAKPEAVERDEILSVLDKMCADGWVAFQVNQPELQKILLRFGSPKVPPFTGKKVIIGIVKPFFEGRESSETSLTTQMRMMLLMRLWGWRLRQFEPRNWIDGCLVDGADVEVEPRHHNYLERSWKSAIYRLLKVRRENGGEGFVKDKQ